MAIKLLLFLFSSFGLNVVQHQQPQSKYNSVEAGSIIIVNNKSVKWNAAGNVQSLQKAFGKAKVKKEEGEAFEGDGYTYSYNGFEAFFAEKAFGSVSITNSNFKMMLNGTPYTAGDNIVKLKKSFPASFKGKEFKAGDKEGRIVIGIKQKKVYTDTYILVRYNKNGNIIEIWSGGDNS